MSSNERTLRLTRGTASPRIRLRSSRLVILDGPAAGRILAVDGRLIRMGSEAGNDLVLDDPSISRRHAVLEDTEEGFRLRDLGSTNGTWINGVRVEGAFLDPGVSFRLGDVGLRFDHRQDSWTADPWPSDSFHGMVGRSACMHHLFSFLHRLAITELSVLILGETGTGKEEAARAVHAASPRGGGPFVVFDGATTQPDLLAATLFGQREGAFTGATRSRPGCFQAADGGTLFLDEVGEIPLELQPMLLRALERREIQPLGIDQPVRVDVRVVAATHRDLEAMVTSGTFRQDLFYRLSGVVLEMPPLRDRPEDIALLARRFLAADGREMKLSAEALASLTAREWPGNVRELRNVLQRAASLCREDLVDLKHLVAGPVKFGPGGPVLPSPPPVPRVSPSGPAGPVSLEERERASIVQALEASRWNLVLASQVLGISRQTLWRRVKSYGLRRPGSDTDPEDPGE